MGIKHLFNFNQEKKAKDFWAWFVTEKSKYLFVGQVDEVKRESLMDKFLSALHEYDNHLFFEIGANSDLEKIELIITAEGVKKHFKSVEFLVDKAPKLADWDIIALKPPMGAGFTTKYRGHEFDPKRIIFIPLESKLPSNRVALKVCYPDYAEEKKSIFLNGTYLMLDVLLGERSVATDIDYLEVGRTPKNIGEYLFFHLDGIQEYIEERKG